MDLSTSFSMHALCQPVKKKVKLNDNSDNNFELQSLRVETCMLSYSKLFLNNKVIHFILVLPHVSSVDMCFKENSND